MKVMGAVKKKCCVHLNWTAVAAVGQLLLFIAVAFTIYQTSQHIDLVRQNIYQQGEFNRNSLRPWVYTEPQETLVIEDGSYRVSFKTRNVGRMPAFNYGAHGKFTYDSAYPVETFKWRAQKNEPKFGYIFPNQEVDDRLIYKYGPGNEPFENLPAMSIRKRLGERKFFLHIYYEYYDSYDKSGEPYAFQATFGLEPLRDVPSGIIYDFSVIYSSYALIR